MLVRPLQAELCLGFYQAETQGKPGDARLCGSNQKDIFSQSVER